MDAKLIYSKPDEKKKLEINQGTQVRYLSPDEEHGGIFQFNEIFQHLAIGGFHPDVIQLAPDVHDMLQVIAPDIATAGQVSNYCADGAKVSIEIGELDPGAIHFGRYIPE